MLDIRIQQPLWSMMVPVARDRQKPKLGTASRKRFCPTQRESRLESLRAARRRRQRWPQPFSSADTSPLKILYFET